MIHVIKVAGAISWFSACLGNVQCLIVSYSGYRNYWALNLIYILYGDMVYFPFLKSSVFKHENSLTSLEFPV